MRHETYLYREIFRIVKSQTSSHKAQKDLTISTDWTMEWQMKITVSKWEKLQIRQKKSSSSACDTMASKLTTTPYDSFSENASSAFLCQNDKENVTTF